MSLAAARFAQRGYCVVHDLEAVAYNPASRVQLDAFMRSVTLDRRTPTRARPLRMDALISFVRKVRATIPVGKGHRWERSVILSERDACMAIIGWWACMRSDDLASLEWSEVLTVPEGLELHLKERKTKEASTRALAERPDCPDICPLRAVQRFRAEIPSGEPSGLVFGLTTGDHVGRRLKRVFARCGVPRGYTSHSLRAGFATECSSQGVNDSLVQAHGHWRSAQQHREYVRLGRLWLDTPTTRLVCPV
jgi:integrase